MQVRAVFEGGVFRALDTVDLDDGAEVLLDIQALHPGAWRDQVSFRCLRVGTLTVTLSWFLPSVSAGAPQVSACRIYQCREAQRPHHPLEDLLQEAVLVATVSPSGEAVSADVSVPVVPTAQDQRLHFGLEFLDPEGESHAVGVLTVPIPGVRLVLEDREDGPPAAWTTEGTWGRMADGVWADSPEGDYANNANFSLTSPWIPLEGLGDPAFSLEEKHNIEEFSDRVYLEISSEDEEWRRLDRFTGVREWNVRRYDLSAFADRRIRLRFRLVTDRSITRDGIYLRNLFVGGRPR